MIVAQTFKWFSYRSFCFLKMLHTGTVLGPSGDYQQLKSFGNTFYGVFSGDGQPFGRPFHKLDPIFIRTSLP